MVNSAPGASVTGPAANRPSRILGPCRSTSTPTLRPLASPAARTLRYAAWWPSWLPWLMLSRATSSPAATSAAVWSAPDVAGAQGADDLRSAAHGGAPSPSLPRRIPHHAAHQGELPETASGLYHYGPAGSGCQER